MITMLEFGCFPYYRFKIRTLMVILKAEKYF